MQTKPTISCMLDDGSGTFGGGIRFACASGDRDKKTGDQEVGKGFESGDLLFHQDGFSLSGSDSAQKT